MLALVKSAGVSWILIFGILGAGSFLSFQKGRIGGLDYLVRQHGAIPDLFFSWFTNLGDGIFILLTAVIFWFAKRRFASLLITISYAVSGIIAQTLKNVFPYPRPAVLFREFGRKIYEIHGVTLMNSNASFPSGHTASAFAMLGSLLLLYPKSNWNPLWILMATAIGYSRMYLGNHFPVDVTAGAFIGLCAAFIAFAITSRIFDSGKLKEV